jgi:hypothetical protein
VLIQEAEKPKGNLVPQHILLVGRGNETISYAGNLLAVLGDFDNQSLLNAVDPLIFEGCYNIKNN